MHPDLPAAGGRDLPAETEMTSKCFLTMETEAQRTHQKKRTINDCDEKEGEYR